MGLFGTDHGYSAGSGYQKPEPYSAAELKKQHKINYDSLVGQHIIKDPKPTKKKAKKRKK